MFKNTRNPSSQAAPAVPPKKSNEQTQQQSAVSKLIRRRPSQTESEVEAAARLKALPNLIALTAMEDHFANEIGADQVKSERHDTIAFDEEQHIQKLAPDRLMIERLEEEKWRASIPELAKDFARFFRMIPLEKTSDDEYMKKYAFDNPLCNWRLQMTLWPAQDLRRWVYQSMKARSPGKWAQLMPGSRHINLGVAKVGTWLDVIDIGPQLQNPDCMMPTFLVKKMEAKRTKDEGGESST